jgi:hypothetical protein
MDLYFHVPIRLHGVNTGGSGYGPMVGCCEHGNKPLGSIQDGEFLDEMSDFQLLRKGCSMGAVSYSFLKCL